MVQCRQYSTISCRGFCLIYLKKYLKCGGPIQVVFYNKLSWFVSELPQKGISNVVVQCRQYSAISCRDLCLNQLPEKTRMFQTYKRFSVYIIEYSFGRLLVHFQNIPNSFRERYHAVSCRDLCLNYLKKISQGVQYRQYSIISCRGWCLNYRKKVSQTWWSSVGSILQ